MISTQGALSQKLSDASRASLQSQLLRMTDVATAGLASMERLLDLNLNVMRASMEESSVMARQLLGAQTPQEAMTLIAQQARPAAEKMMAYGRHLGSIAAATQAELARSTEAQLAEAGAALGRALEQANRDAPPGAGQMIALMKSNVGSLNAGYEQLNRAMQQMRDSMEASMQAATSQMMAATPQEAATKASAQRPEPSGTPAGAAAAAG